MKMPADAIREEILKSGVISFARFMELALYCPESGYYEEKKDMVGRRGDFITSVSTGSLFGELLGFQFAEWLQESSKANSHRMIVEAGAHDGKLAQDILGWLRASRPALFPQVEYVIVEPSERRREWQRETLKAFFGTVSWTSRVAELKKRQALPGIIFSNELLDAFPVHRYGWDALAKRWFEWGVGLLDGNFVWSREMEPESGQRPLCPPELEAVLPDGYIVETCPAAEEWWREAAEALSCGKLMTIDYGLSTEELFSPARTGGTLRAYRRHRVTNDLLADPGEQDLTAHVNFTAIQEAGESAGLRTEQFCTQPQFLTRILQKAVAEKSFVAMDAKRVRQFQTLTHPEHLGRAFRVLVQSRGRNSAPAL